MADQNANPDSNPNPNDKYYTFFYCDMHDDGAIIRGNYKYLDDNIKICPGGKCCTVDYSDKGVIKYDGNEELNYEAVKPISYNYNRYGGGYKFKYYSSNILDENGNMIDENAQEFKMLKKLIENMNNIYMNNSNNKKKEYKYDY